MSISALQFLPKENFENFLTSSSLIAIIVLVVGVAGGLLVIVGSLLVCKLCCVGNFNKFNGSRHGRRNREGSTVFNVISKQPRILTPIFTASEPLYQHFMPENDQLDNAAEISEISQDSGQANKR